MHMHTIEGIVPSTASEIFFSELTLRLSQFGQDYNFHTVIGWFAAFQIEKEKKFNHFKVFKTYTSGKTRVCWQNSRYARLLVIPKSIPMIFCNIVSCMSTTRAILHFRV